MKKYKVCVYCATYNHEKYIRKTLEGFVNQQTNFDYYCIIHDDASKDGTAKIIQEFEERYPSIIRGIYQKDNQKSQGVNIVKEFILPRVDSDYIAICEGDDFWCDDSKLQKQYNILNKYRNCYMCLHLTKEIFEDGRITGINYPNFNQEEGYLKSEEIIEKGYSYHTSSYFFDAMKWKEYISNPPKFRKLCDVGDIPYLLYFAYIGKVYYLPLAMSCYRRGVHASWTVTRAKLSGDKFIKNLIIHANKMKDTYIEYNKFTNYCYDIHCRKKIATYLLQSFTLLCQNKLFLKKENTVYFFALPITRKLFILFSILFPLILKEIYVYRIKSLNKKNMGIK